MAESSPSAGHSRTGYTNRPRLDTCYTSLGNHVDAGSVVEGERVEIVMLIDPVFFAIFVIVVVMVIFFFIQYHNGYFCIMSFCYYF